MVTMLTCRNKYCFFASVDGQAPDTDRRSCLTARRSNEFFVELGSSLWSKSAEDADNWFTELGHILEVRIIRKTPPAEGGWCNYYLE